MIIHELSKLGNMAGLNLCSLFDHLVKSTHALVPHGHETYGHMKAKHCICTTDIDNSTLTIYRDDLGACTYLDKPSQPMFIFLVCEFGHLHGDGHHSQMSTFSIHEGYYNFCDAGLFLVCVSGATCCSAHPSLCVTPPACAFQTPTNLFKHKRAST